MSRHLFKYPILLSFVCLLVLNIGCADKSEQQTKPTAVSKKIVAKKSETAPAADAAPAVVPQAKQSPEVKEVKNIPPAAKQPSGAEKSQVSAPPPQKMQAKPAEAVKPEEGIKKEAAKTVDKPAVPAVLPETKSASPAGPKPLVSAPAAELAKIQAETTLPYNPHGRIDPFVPLFKDEGPLTAAEKERKGRAPRTPLEMIDLGQLKLVAVMRAPSGNKALVEEASGKGYIVSKGTYLGMNSGKVVKILKDRIIVEEEVESIVGKSTIQERELKLQKPLGEE